MLIRCILRREHGVTVTLPIADGLDATYLFRGQFPDGPQGLRSRRRARRPPCWRSPKPIRVYQPAALAGGCRSPGKAIEDQRLADEARAKQLLDAKKARGGRRRSRRSRGASPASSAPPGILENKATVEEARTIAAGGSWLRPSRGAGEPQNLPLDPGRRRGL